MAQNSPHQVARIRDDLLSWLAESEGALPLAFGCDYDPRPDGFDERSWVRAMTDYLGRSVAD